VAMYWAETGPVNSMPMMPAPHSHLFMTIPSVLFRTNRVVAEAF
jgi:hypothetical protein